MIPHQFDVCKGFSGIAQVPRCAIATLVPVRATFLITDASTFLPCR